jgi:hypothetical protein
VRDLGQLSGDVSDDVGVVFGSGVLVFAHALRIRWGGGFPEPFSKALGRGPNGPGPPGGLGAVAGYYEEDVLYPGRAMHTA